jgi:hypothetical protein
MITYTVHACNTTKSQDVTKLHTLHMPAAQVPKQRRQPLSRKWTT